MTEPDDGEADLSDRERARQRHRDRKRRTRMVVDNAGVRRVLEALQRRRAPRTQGRERRDARRPS